MPEKSNTNSVKRLWLLLTAGVIALLLPCAALAQSAADGFTPNVNGLVRAVAVQSDGKIVVGGLFSSVNGQARSNLARLNVDGSLGTTFSFGTNGTVFALCIQSGKILVGGSFATLAGQARNNLGRLNSDGSLDATFNQGANAAVYALKLQADYQVVVGGNFTTLGGLPHNHVGRISNGGVLDNSFNPSVSGAIYGLELQNDGRIVIGGSFATVNNQPHNNIARLNTDGNLDTSFNPSANNSVSSLAVQPDGKILVGGDFTIMNSDGRNHIARINADGSLDAVFNPNADGYVDAIVLRPDGCIFIGGAFTAVAGTSIGRLAPLTANGNIGPLLGGTNNTVHALAIQWDGKLLVGGQFTTANGSHLARYNMDNLVDSNFTGGVGGGGVYALATQPDGKLLVGGSFTSMAGLPIPYIARLNQNGSFDIGFNASANGPVYSIAVQSDGKILVGGDFTIFNGQTAYRLVRLLPTGIVDNVSSFSAAADDLINGIVVQPDGKILVSGFFLNIDAQFQPSLARLNANGSFDTSFNPYFDNGVTAVALQPDGKILAGGLFTSVTGQARSHLARLNANGSLDAGFNPGANDDVYAIAIQSDGKILLGGDFSVLGGQSRSLLGRLNANGALDTSFNPNVDSLLGTSYVTTLTVQTDGKILLGGNLFIIAGQIVDNLVRLSANGVLDAGFASGANDTVNAVLLQSDGKIVVSGYFTALGGQPRSGFGRLTNTGPAIQYLSTISANTSLLWGRNGTEPEIKRATFESSTDGINYNFIGEGTRTILNSWNFNNLSLPTDQIVYIRARGFYAAGSVNGSGSIVESVLQTYIPSVTPCTFSLSQSNQNFTAAGSSGSVALTASSSICAWTVQSNAAWITPAVFSGSGSTSIGYIVAANPGAQRSGTMTIGGQTFTVTQDAASCSYSVTPQTLNVAASAGGNNVTITTTAICAWTATSNAAWMVLNASSGTGSSIVGLTIAANPNVAPRIGTLTVAGQTVTVTQDGAMQFTNLQFYPLAHPVRLL
ncbi:MAG TPA: BACON domain-containing carbohydrate-binding protein, partial [Blastocatellia bacterium]|nr:BACON domain-containing carbohydrate-binding protein [Blastocatellia bacterium]